MTNIERRSILNNTTQGERIDTWYRTDDSIVTECKEKDVLNQKDAYLLFYEKKKVNSHTTATQSNRASAFTAPTFSTSFPHSTILSNADYMIKNNVDQKKVEVVVKPNQSLYSSLYGENYVIGTSIVNNNAFDNYYANTKNSTISYEENIPDTTSSTTDMDVYGYSNYGKDKFSGDITSYQSFDTTRKRSNSNAETATRKKHTNGISRNYGDKSNGNFFGHNGANSNRHQNNVDNNEKINQNENEKRTNSGDVIRSEKNPRENNQNDEKSVTLQNSMSDTRKKIDLFHGKENNNNNNNSENKNKIDTEKSNVNTKKKQKISDTENENPLKITKMTENFTLHSNSIFPNLKKVATKISQGTVQMLKNIVFVPEGEESTTYKCTM